MVRDTVKYHFKKGNLIVHTGITKHPKRRAGQHRSNVGSGHLKIVGRRVSRASALAWERSQTRQGKPTIGYRLSPKSRRPRRRR